MNFFVSCVWLQTTDIKIGITVIAFFTKVLLLFKNKYKNINFRIMKSYLQKCGQNLKIKIIYSHLFP